MKRMVLTAFMVFCSLLLPAEEKASAIPYTFTWDVNGSINGGNLGTSDQNSWSALFFIESTDLSFSDTWGSSGTIQNASGDVAYNIDFFNTVTYDLDCSKTYNVDWRITVGAQLENSQGCFDWEIEAQMNRIGSALWLAQDKSVSGFVLDHLGTDSYMHNDPTLATGSAAQGSMTAESTATMDRLNVQGDVSLNANIYSSEGYSDAAFSGTLEVVPDVMPAPGGLMLAAFGIGIVGWLRGRRTL
jgi:hypothetical protein